MAQDSFPRPYRNSIPQDLDNPDSMVYRVPVSKTDIGARKSVLGQVKDDNPFKIKHAPDENSH